MNADAQAEPSGTGAVIKAVNPDPTSPKRKGNKHVKPDILEVRRRIQQCCKTNDLETALNTYKDAVSKGIRIEAQTFYSLLNLCGGMDRRIHIGTPKAATPQTPNLAEKSTKEIETEARKAEAFRIREHMRKENIPLNETAFTALVKIVSSAGDISLAESLIAEAEGIQQCRLKLRLFSPLISTYCEMGELLPALRIWERLSKHGLSLTEKEYACLIQCSTKCGDASVMARVFSDLSEDVLVPSRNTCRAIVQWFQSSFSRSSAENEVHSGDMAETSLLDQVNLPTSKDYSLIGQVQCCSTGWDIKQVCHVESSTGVLLEGCLQGAKLRPVMIPPSTWQDMMQNNEEIVLSGKLEGDNSIFQGGKKGRKRKLGVDDRNERSQMWGAFKEYLKKRGNRLDVVIDGANVGYYEMNYTGASKHVNYHQIDWIVQHFLREGKQVLLVLHRRHFATNLMPKSMLPIVRSWEDSGVLYRTPAGMNDDWFWLHAALVSGSGTLVVTNDEMRDHHFQMLAPRSFLRWKDRHQVKFSFGANEYDQNGRSSGRSVELSYPEVYSRRIQSVLDGFVIPNIKRGDENLFLDGMHVASTDEPAEETYICIRPKK